MSCNDSLSIGLQLMGMVGILSENCRMAMP